MRIRAELTKLAVNELDSPDGGRFDLICDALVHVNEVTDDRFEGLEELFLAKPWERFTDFDIALNAPAFIRLCQTCDCWPVPYNAMFHTLAEARKVFVSKDQESKYPQLEDLIEQTKEAILKVGLDIADSPGCGFEGILEPWKKHEDQVVSYVAIKAESLWLVEV